MKLIFKLQLLSGIYLQGAPRRVPIALKRRIFYVFLWEITIYSFRSAYKRKIE